MKVAKTFLWFLALNVIMSFMFFYEAHAARIPGNRILIYLTFDEDGELVVRIDKAILRGRTRPEDLDREPVVLAEKNNKYCQAPNSCSDQRFVLQPVVGNPRWLEIPAKLIVFDSSCKCFRFTTGRLDISGFISGTWSFTFELRQDQIGGGIVQVSNPPETGRPGTTAFAINLSREDFGRLARIDPMHIEGKFLFVPEDLLPSLDGVAQLSHDGSPDWCANQDKPCGDDVRLVNDADGFLRVSICNMQGVRKLFNVGVSTLNNGINQLWMELRPDRVGENIGVENGSYVLLMSDSELAEVCK